MATPHWVSLSNNQYVVMWQCGSAADVFVYESLSELAKKTGKIIISDSFVIILGYE